MSACKNCMAPISDDQNFCSNCGAATDSVATQAAIVKAILQAEVGAAVKENLKDTKSLELETAQAIVGRVGEWAKLFALFVGVPVALFLGWLALLGISSYNDFSTRIAKAQTEVISDIQKTQNSLLEQLNRDITKLRKESMDQIKNLQESSKLAASEAEATSKLLKEDSAKLVEQYGLIKRQLADASKLAADVQSLSTKVDRIESRLDLTFYESGMQITDDGKCSADCEKSPYRSDKTAYVHPDTKEALDPLTIPYVSVPQGRSGTFGIQLGDLCAVFNKRNGKIAYAVVGDLRPRNRNGGEGSIALARMLDIRSDPRSGGVPSGIVYVTFPESKLNSHITPELIAREGEKRFLEWGGLDKLKARLKSLN